jgi:DNA-binding MarR family transcriptional regulator
MAVSVTAVMHWRKAARSQFRAEGEVHVGGHRSNITTSEYFGYRNTMPRPRKQLQAAGDVQALRERVMRLGREVGARSTLFDQAVGEQLGISAGDLNCLELVLQAQPEPVTPGRIAELSGMPTATLTGVLDRLERVGLIRRQRDPRDRRRVLVHPIAKAMKSLEDAYTTLSAGYAALLARFDAQQLASFCEFFTGSLEVVEQSAAELRRERQRRQGETESVQGSPIE